MFKVRAAFKGKRTRVQRATLGFMAVSGLALLPVLGAATADAKPAGGAVPTRSRPGIRLQEIGHPQWEPVGFRTFSAPIGTAADGYAEFVPTQLSLLPDHAYHPQLIVGPGTPHPPPYNGEFPAGVAAQGFDTTGPFAPTQFSAGAAVYVVFMVVPRPGSPVGSSPDFSSGPIIPNSMFPFHFKGTTLRNGQLWDPYLGEFSVPAINDPSLTPSWNVDGTSHFPVFIADNADFGPAGEPLVGRYSFAMTALDVAGNGWSISASFVIR